MAKAIAEPRKELSPYAPKINVMTIDPSKIGEVVGKQGKTINMIIEKTGVQIDITDDGIFLCGGGANLSELQEELAQKNIRIAELDSAVQGLTKERNALVADSDNKDLTIAVQDKALNTAWFVFGTKKELKEQKILSSGGLFRKSEVLSSSDANMDYFTQVDIRKATEIKLYSKDAELLTNHPDGSYELVSDESGELTLKISNPTQFWSMSKYLVVQVK